MGPQYSADLDLPTEELKTTVEMKAQTRAYTDKLKGKFG